MTDADFFDEKILTCVYLPELHETLKALRSLMFPGISRPSNFSSKEFVEILARKPVPEASPAT